MKKKKFIKIIIEWLIYVAVFVFIVWGTPLALSKILKTSYPVASVTSSSMWPVLKKGDVVLIKGIQDKVEVNLGDIVVYTNSKGFTIHRVVKLNENNLITKGDANNTEDKSITYDKIIGKTVNYKNKPWRLPWLGKISQLIKR